MRRAIAAALVGLATVALSACTIGDPPPPQNPPTPTITWGGEVNQDTAPFRKHFPDLGALVSAIWTKGSYGSPATGRVQLPSPTSARLSAIVELDPAVAAKLRTRISTAKPTPGKPKRPANPEVAPEISAQLPAGPWVSGEDHLGTAYGWSVVVHVHRDRPVLVLLGSLPWATGFTG